jgi:hypothetical protein
MDARCGFLADSARPARAGLRGLRCDLIVLATRGGTGLLRLLLGSSKAERVIRRAPCPILAHRAQQPPQAHGRMRDPLKASA